MPISDVFLEDCMIGMARYPDKFFDLAIVDPPYGININHNMGRRRGDKPSEYKPADWDNSPPPKIYFDELWRISTFQVIWGANHFISRMPFKDTPCWLLWDKRFSEDLSFAQFELAWTNFPGTCKKYERLPNLVTRIHLTQKPVDLYRWILSKFATDGMKILDTHMGSQSSRIAAFNMGFDYWGWEIDKDYFEAGNKRFKEQTAQTQLFDDPDLYTTFPDF
jgi:site-specific DNA-methyltransferase (adenine-specific)